MTPQRNSLKEEGCVWTDRLRHWLTGHSIWGLTGSHTSQPSLCRAEKFLSSWWARFRKTNMSPFSARRQDRGPRGMASPILTFLSNPSFIYPYLQRFLDRALLTRPLPKACLELLHREPIPPEKVTLGEFHIPGIRTITQGWSDCPCGFPPKPSSLESPAS